MKIATISCLLLSFGLAACSATRAAQEKLPGTVGAYHELLRWKKFDGAARFRLAEDQPQFMARYVTAEDDLSVDAIEIRQIAYPPVAEDEPLVAMVTVVAHAYLLPSTVLEKIIMLQRWENRGGSWVLLETSRELVPPVDMEPEPTEPETPSEENQGSQEPESAGEDGVE